MKKLRFWMIILGVWLTFFFNIERIIFYEVKANIIRSDTYIFVAIVALIALLLPRLSNLSFSLLLITIIAIFLVLWYYDPNWSKSVSGNLNQLNATTLLTLIQINAIILTGLLTRQITYQLSEFENTIADITFSHIGKRPTPFSEEQGAMYREVRRAARYGRPLGMIALRVEEESIQTALPQMVKEVQQAMMKEYTLAGIARILDENLLGFDTIALRNNCFVVALPETVRENTERIAQRLEQAVKEKTGIQLQIGTATFPDQAMTFESLIERAVDNINRQSEDPVTLKQDQRLVQEI